MSSTKKATAVPTPAPATSTGQSPSLHITHELIVQLESAKRASDQLIHELPEVIFIVDERGRILKGNHAAQVFLGLGPRAWFLSPLSALFSMTSWQSFWTQLSRLHGQLPPVKQVEFDLNCDGSRGGGRFVHWYIRRIPGVSARRGNLYYVVGHDISDTKQMLAEIQDSHQQLETHSRELESLLSTVQKQKVQMVETSKLAQLGEMAGGIAHEINNPITIIKGHAEHIQMLVAQTPLNTAQLSRSAGVIAATVDRIAAIVKSMRSLSRDGAHDPFDLVDLHAIANEALVFFREKFRAHNIDLRLEVGEDPLVVPCRAVQISQVLINLLNNAHDAVANKPTPWVKVILRKQNAHAVIQVIDCGNGIPPEIAAKIMQPFFTTKASGHGTGLGLSITSAIIQQHRGTFELDTSSPHTCFVVNLPLHDEAAKA